MSQLIVPGGRTEEPKPKAPEGPVTVSWAVLVCVTDNGQVHVTHTDMVPEIDTKRPATEDDILGAAALLESMTPGHIVTANISGECECAFLIVRLPTGRVAATSDIYQLLLENSVATSQQIWMAASVVKAELTAAKAVSMMPSQVGPMLAATVNATAQATLTLMAEQRVNAGILQNTGLVRA